MSHEAASAAGGAIRYNLKLFIAVGEGGNLTRAAERERLAVSSVSKRISELEAIAAHTTAATQPARRGADAGGAVAAAPFVANGMGRCHQDAS